MAVGTIAMALIVPFGGGGHCHCFAIDFVLSDGQGRSALPHRQQGYPRRAAIRSLAKYRNSKNAANGAG